MDRNVVLAFSLSMLVFTMWLMYQSQVAPPPSPITGDSMATTENADRAVDDAADSSPELKRTLDVVPPRDVTPTRVIVEESDSTPAWSRTFDLPLSVVEMTNRGAAIRRWTLKEFHLPPAEGGGAIELVTAEEDDPPALTNALRSLGVGDLSNAYYEVEAESDAGVSFVLERGGVRVRKIYAFEPENYGFRLTISVDNDGDRIISPTFETRWPARLRDGNDFAQVSLAAQVEGSVEREEVTAIGVEGFFSSGETSVYPAEIEWAGVDNKYFLAALLPDRVRSARAEFPPTIPGKEASLLLSFVPVEVPPGQRVEHVLRGYAGPKQVDDMVAVDASLENSVNRGYSWVAPLTGFFEWMLRACYSVVPNYGLAIIILTLMVRLVTAPIMGKQMKSAERMRAVQPLLKEIQEKHGDDRQKQSEAMLALYKKEGVNPLAGCLPMLLQFPVFIGLFFALQSSFELRQADFMLWITDLSAPEALFMLPIIDLPLRVLPVVMGASMILQQKLTPTTIDPAQARMMMIVMPIMFTVLFYQFPSGLVLYWMISNFLGIAHQLWVGKRMRPA